MSTTDWERYGLPEPTLDGYGYTVAGGISRTTYDDGSVRQRRRRPRGRRQYRLTWEVDAAVLQTLELWLAAYASTWFPWPGPEGELTLRMVSGPEVAWVQHDRARVTITAEAAPSA